MCSNAPILIDSIIIISQLPIISPLILILLLVKQTLLPQLIHLSPEFRIVINKRWILQLLILQPLVISLLTTSTEFVDEAQGTTINEVGNAHNLQHLQMLSREKPHLHVDEELRVFALILIDVDADTMSHASQGQKSGKNSSTETHRVPMGLVGFKRKSVSCCTLEKGIEKGIKKAFNNRPIILPRINSMTLVPTIVDEVLNYSTHLLPGLLQGHPSSNQVPPPYGTTNPRGSLLHEHSDNAP